MKTVLCFGDSLTWGADAETGGRHPFGYRWPNVLQKALGDGVHVIAEGLGGRTTAYDDPTALAERSGTKMLPTLLSSHEPLDLVVIMLGSNDMKPKVAGRAIDAMLGMERLVEQVKHHAWRQESDPPDVLLVAPPVLCETANPIFGAIYAGSIEESKMIASYYADLADEMGCGFFDAASVATTTPLDGVHLDAENTRAIGKGLAPIVRVMLGL
ncbi:SGNH/GDSL hydrolase family protein [Pararhizobium haloflavum]|uniref:SGNH/GDSL hydrolase family protein n=1 Tax=Pararhizobium haloflavum TaxID=2037914 RepID=UPI000C178F88|nr:SGNH/GDSL hydrolase family protein [Pararhizobium haloflavum]